jgi:RNA polymerase sigma-70 factor (ECF subfamily)
MAVHPFEEHIPRLRRYATALLRDRARADDLVQDTLERALRKFTLFRRGTDLRAWLFTVMHNVYVNQARAASNRAATVEYEDTEAAPESVDNAVALRDLLAGIERLSPEQREVVLLVGLEQLSYEETARVLDVPIGTVMSRLARGRERLHALMAGGSATAPYLRRIK